MFCKNCGKEISDNAVVCPNCGAQAAELKTAEPKPLCTMAIVGFVLSFVVSIAGLICSIIARKKCREENLEGEGLAFAGIIISAITLGISAICILILIFSMISMIGIIGYAASFPNPV